MKTVKWDECPEVPGDPKHGRLLVGDGAPSDAQLDACIDQQVHACLDQLMMRLTLKGRAEQTFDAEVLGPVDDSAPLPGGLCVGDRVALPMDSIHAWGIEQRHGFELKMS